MQVLTAGGPIGWFGTMWCEGRLTERTSRCVGLCRAETQHSSPGCQQGGAALAVGMRVVGVEPGGSRRPAVVPVV